MYLLQIRKNELGHPQSQLSLIPIEFVYYLGKKLKFM